MVEGVDDAFQRHVRFSVCSKPNKVTQIQVILRGSNRETNILSQYAIGMPREKEIDFLESILLHHEDDSMDYNYLYKCLGYSHQLIYIYINRYVKCDREFKKIQTMKRAKVNSCVIVLLVNIIHMFDRKNQSIREFFKIKTIVKMKVSFTYAQNL